ncbi:MAG: hypothetical protein E7353_00145 [Clostridiales bacterium]|nr:hypothetical protein [Clostridiales bacterium]
MFCTWDYSSWYAWLQRFVCPFQIFFEIFTVKYLIRFFKCCIAIRSASRRQDAYSSNFTVIKCGENGTGKTLTGIDYAISLAEEQDDVIRKTYKLYKANRKAVEKDEILSKDFKELEEYIEFWDAHEDCFPGLFSTVPIFVDGLKVMELKRDHVLQYIRLPYGSVCLYDEAKLDFPAVGTPTAEERAEESPGADFISKVRHYGNFHFIFVSQKSSELRKFIRNNVAMNEYIIKNEKILRPNWMLDFINWLEDYIYDFPINVNFLYKPIFYIKKFLNKIGFFKFQSVTYSNTETETGKTELEKKVYYMPLNKDFIYDSRCYRTNYKAKKETLSYNKAFSGLQRRDLYPLVNPEK